MIDASGRLQSTMRGKLSGAAACRER